MRVLIAGGGVAGLALAGLLERQGRSPIVAERLSRQDHAAVHAAFDHGVELSPVGTGVFHGLGAFAELVDRSVELARYRTLSDRGEVLQEVDLADTVGAAGPFLSLANTDLLAVLASRVDPDRLRWGAQVVDVATTAHGTVVARFADGGEEEVDVVVAADGMRSDVRAALWGDLVPYETDWTVATWWSPSAVLTPPGTVSELWGTGVFVRLCPRGSGVDVTVGMPVLVAPPSRLDAAADVLAALRTVVTAGCEAAADLPGLFDAIDGRVNRWPMREYRAPGIVAGGGRIALCGDAGTGFLPGTAMGAANALRSAAALAYELSLSGAPDVPLALERWRRRVEPVVRANQNMARSLARLMLSDAGVRTRVADLGTGHHPMSRLAKGVRDTLAEPF